MTIKIMSWNIQFFTNRKLSGTTPNDILISGHIVDAIKVVNPDTLVVIEVRSGGSSGIGSLITGYGRGGGHP